MLISAAGLKFSRMEDSVKIITVASLLLTAVPALAQTAPVPEPSTTLLMGVGLLGIGYVAFKKRKTQ
jgi:hypothetical protein